MTLRTDASRQRFRPQDQRPLRDVLPRQGQVLLDADLDQAQRLILDRVERETDDILGQPGRLVVPEGDDGFKVIAGGAGPLGVKLRPGHGYLGGWRLDLTAEVQLDTQPHPRPGEAAAQPYALAIKALERFIDPLEEPVWADKALGDAEAAGRGLLDWQVFALPLAAGASCATVLSDPAWTALVAPSTGTMGVKVGAAAAGDDPCSLLPQGGYSRLENLLYRLEVHGGTPIAGSPVADGPRFRLQGLQLKLSRFNASQMVPVDQVAGVTLTLGQPPRDPRHWFAPGLYGELVQSGDDLDSRAALKKERLFRVASASDTQVVLDAAAADVAATGAAGAAGWFLRLWEALPDAKGTITVGAPGGGGLAPEIDLGDGLILVPGGGAAGFFRRSDAWTFAARADGSIDWPAGAAQEVPHVPQVRYAPLAVVSGAGIEDCRITFGRLTDAVLHYRGGDGQEAFPPGGGGLVKLPAQLSLQVLRGQVPVVGTMVAFRLPVGAQTSQVNGQPVAAGQSPQFATDAQGLVQASWEIDAGAPFALHQVQAVLVAGGTGGVDQPVTFTAAFRLAKQVAYQPTGCAILSKVDNVQDALTALCEASGQGEVKALTLKRIALLDPNFKSRVELIDKDLILNGKGIAGPDMLGGFGFAFDVPDLLQLGIHKEDPVVEVSVDLPYPVTTNEKLFWMQNSRRKTNNLPGITSPFGYQTIRLQGAVRVGDNVPTGEFAMIWEPSPQAAMFLRTLPIHLGGQIEDADTKGMGWVPDRQNELLLRLRLRSAHIWAANKKDAADRLYLNAEYLGVNEGATGRELALPLRDPQKAADLDCFFYLALG